MADMDVTRVVRDIANLRIQINALEVSSKGESLPAVMKETRRTVRWSAFVIAFTLMTSSTLKYCSDSRVERLEKRVEILEKRQASFASP